MLVTFPWVLRVGGIKHTPPCLGRWEFREEDETVLCIPEGLGRCSPFPDTTELALTVLLLQLKTQVSPYDLLTVFVTQPVRSRARG